MESDEIKIQLESDLSDLYSNSKALKVSLDYLEVDYVFNKKCGRKCLSLMGIALTVTALEDFDYLTKYFEDPLVYSKKKEQLMAAISNVKVLEKIMVGSPYDSSQGPKVLTAQQSYDLGSLELEILDLVRGVQDDVKSDIKRLLNVEKARYEIEISRAMSQSLSSLKAVQNVAFNVIDEVCDARIIVRSVVVAKSFGCPLDKDGVLVEHSLGKDNKIVNYLSHQDVQLAVSLTSPTVFINCLDESSRDHFIIRVANFNENLCYADGSYLVDELMAKNSNGSGRNDCSLVSRTGDKLASDCKSFHKFKKLLTEAVLDEGLKFNTYDIDNVEMEPSR